jgi:hypothetical protein
MTDEWLKIEGAQVWNFHEKPEIIGKLIRKEDGQYTKNYIIQLDDKQEWLLYGKTVLDRKLEQVNPEQRIKIVFLGKQTSADTGRTYDNFEVYLAKSSTETV